MRNIGTAIITTAVALTSLAACRLSVDATPRGEGPDAALDEAPGSGGAPGPGGATGSGGLNGSGGETGSGGIMDAGTLPDAAGCSSTVPVTGCTNVSDPDGGRAYVLCPTRVTWAAAFCDCAARGMTMVRIDNQDTNVLLHDRMALLANNTDLMWLGANDLAEHGRWDWADGTLFHDQSTGTVAGMFASWNSGEPNGAAGADCAAMYLKNQGPLWLSLGCNWTHLIACQSP